MVLKFDENKKILWFNGMISLEDYEKIKNDFLIWIDITIPETEDKEGYNPVFYLNDDMQSIRVEYEPIKPQSNPVTLEDVMTEVQKKNSDIETATIDRYTLELMEEGVL